MRAGRDRPVSFSSLPARHFVQELMSRATFSMSLILSLLELGAKTQACFHKSLDCMFKFSIDLAMVRLFFRVYRICLVLFLLLQITWILSSQARKLYARFLLTYVF